MTPGYWDTYCQRMALLAVTLGRDFDDARRDAYWAALGDLTDEEFTLASAKLTAGFRSTPAEMFPLPATIRQYARPYQDHAAAGVRLFEQVAALGDYLPTGTRWSMAKIGAQLGWAAAEAFSAAGGSSAFERLGEGQNLTFTRKAFVDAYQRACDAAAKRLAPPPSDPPALPASARLKALTAGIGDGPTRLDWRARQAGEEAS